MIQVYADGGLAYDSRLEDHRLLGLTVTVGVDIAGTASLVMPPHHPAYNAFTSYKTLVEVYRDGVLIFRGRALYPEDDFYNRRTIICEGERCFLRDGTIRPYLYQDGPEAIFADVIDLYNAQVEPFKQFTVGTVNVTDPNNYVRLESESAMSAFDVIAKLVERCGGYIVFTTNEGGQRCINWYEDLNYASGQVIEFGNNLLDFARNGANTDLATVIIPYGAKNEETGQRVDITSVNDGLDFIQDYDAVALRGVISKAVYWDDITEPLNLLHKAQQYLATSKLMVTTLMLTAVDLSAMDKNIDTFQVGDMVTVRSKPHGIQDDTYRLRERVYDLLQPNNDRVTLGKDVATLTGADAAGDRKSTSALQRVEHNIRSDYQLNIAQAIAAAEASLQSLIQQTSEAIRLEVSETYAVNDEVLKLVSTSMEQLSDSFTFSFNDLQAYVDANDDETRKQYDLIQSYIRFEDGDIILGEAGNAITLRIENDRIIFLDGGAEVAYFSNQRLVVTDANILTSLSIGAFKFRPRTNGNLSLVGLLTELPADEIEPPILDG